jgi:hypothetical protein
MEEKAPRQNNLPLLLLHLSATSTGWCSARSSRISLDPTRFVFGGRRLAPSWVAILSAAIVVFVVLQLGEWMMTGGGVPLLRLHRMKLTASGSGDHGKDPRPMCHKVLVSLLAAVRFISSKSIFVCEGALPDLGMAAILLFFPPRPWRRQGTMVDDVSARHKFLQGWTYSLTSCEVLCAKLLDTYFYFIW